MIKKVLQLIVLFGFCSTSAQVKTLTDKNNDRIRATPIAIGKSDFTSVPLAFSQDPKSYIQIKNLGFNTVRLCWVDPWFQMNKKEFWTVDEILPYIDKAVKNAKAAGVNIIMNYHNVGEFQKTQKFGMMEEFWQKVAPRYKDNDLVYYELNNEQAWTAKAYLSKEFMKTMQRVYTQVRKDAPKRQVILFSFNSLQIDMKSVVDSYKWIDWKYTTVGWHLYGSPKGNKIEEERNMLNLITNYRTICTEWDYTDKADYVKEYFGHKVNSQVLEYYGISWADWRGWNDATLDEYKELLIPDAKTNGYWWKSESN